MKEAAGRLRLLDILRGFAVLGTLGTNIWLFAHLGDVNYMFTFTNTEWWSSIQDFVRVFVLFLVNGKLLGLLTIMFGVGLEMKYRQTLRKGHAWPGMYIWTSLILLAEGFIHFTLVMEYDILMSYGITAILAAFIVKNGDKAINLAMKIVGGLHGTVMLLILFYFVSLAFSGAHFSMGDMKETVLLYREGSWQEQAANRLANFLPLRSEAILVIPMNLFLFLLGIRLMRSGVFAMDERGRRHRRKLLRIGLYAGIPLNLLIFVPSGYFDLPIRYLFAPLMSLAYLGLIAKLYEMYSQWWLWSKLEAVGKMSLSCYVMQNVMCAVIFYGWGFGLGGKVNSAAIAGLWIAVSCIQILFATLWLKRFRLGPMESARRFASGLISKS
ncbi:DUF418 domain-containing protein [Paenibacillus sp. PAMC21692]|uniref:DUF418 domain-containing protein n=1 Tax=Paenibacillus sp. PAMC21692 TaxID=2762320 RepID=UPI00164D1DAE|nr:DUF418 domain-containing protein [Paenibacillus sp. PAMC21692]QNK60883.1 DUF418 domain-containing protein [Paenibacillus sp. PAMC21692]